MPQTDSMDQLSRIVMFDTCVVESKYIWPLLRGEQLRDVAILGTAGYTPAIFIKTLYEIWYHLHVGGGGIPDLKNGHLGYPGCVTGYADKFMRGKIPGVMDSNLLAYFWFNLSEEWAYRDWDRVTRAVERSVDPAHHEQALSVLEVQEQFDAWKREMREFCKRVERLIKSAGFQIVQYQSVFCQRESNGGIIPVDYELAFESLIPNEDFELVVASVACDAAAIVTADSKLQGRMRASLGLRFGAPALVAHECLVDAVDDGFALAFYTKRQRAHD